MLTLFASLLKDIKTTICKIPIIHRQICPCSGSGIRTEHVLRLYREGLKRERFSTYWNIITRAQDRGPFTALWSLKANHFATWESKFISTYLEHRKPIRVPEYEYQNPAPLQARSSGAKSRFNNGPCMAQKKTREVWVMPAKRHIVYWRLNDNKPSNRCNRPKPKL